MNHIKNQAWACYKIAVRNGNHTRAKFFRDHMNNDARCAWDNIKLHQRIEDQFAG